jgi:hypothetical protein
MVALLARTAPARARPEIDQRPARRRTGESDGVNCTFGRNIGALMPQERESSNRPRARGAARIRAPDADENLVAARVRSRYPEPQQGRVYGYFPRLYNAAPARQAIYPAVNNRCWRSDVP